MHVRVKLMFFVSLSSLQWGAFDRFSNTGEIQFIKRVGIASGCHDFHSRMRFLTLDIAIFVIYVMLFVFTVLEIVDRKTNTSNMINDIGKTYYMYTEAEKKVYTCVHVLKIIPHIC